MNVKHTPVVLHGKGFRPDTRNGGEFIPLIGSSGEWLADIRKNRDFHNYLVRAVNTHETLVDSLEKALSAIDMAVHENLIDPRGFITVVRSQARSALKLAKEGE